jgi:hypothetical protein
MNPAYHRVGPFGYGSLWWVWDGPAATGPFRGAYTAQGAIGRFITVVPAVHLVIAHETRPEPGKETPLNEYLGVVNGRMPAQALGGSHRVARRACW